MNNEEKKPLEGETKEVPSGATKETKGGSAEGKSGLSREVKIAIIAVASLLVVGIIALVLILTLGGDSGNVPGGGGDGENGGGSSETEVTYTIKVVTKGGMLLTKLPVYILEYEDGAIGDIVVFAATDESGKATVKLPKDGSYAAKIDYGLPDGYDAQSFYPLLSTDFTIEISSSILPDNGLSGVSYNLGSVMQDFTVTTTEGEKFTLSEVLKEKKAVLINFWYTTCSWCVTEFPLMQSAYEKYKDDLAIIALDPPAINNDTIYDITQFKSSYGLTFDVAMDNLGLFSAFGVEGYPTSVMIDRYGVVTFIEPGAITSERAFEEIFKFFTADDYVQKLVVNKNDIIPKEKPNVQMPSSEEISNVFDKGAIDGIEYVPYRDNASASEKEYSWPFIIDQVELGGELFDVIKSSNANKEGSFAQILFDVSLKAGDVLAFDYFASTEKGADILYVVVDGKDIYSISGQNEKGWETCYAYVAEEDATYEVGLVYQKDTSDNVGEDTVFLKDLRVVAEADIDSETYIYRFAATKPDGFGAYGEYASIWPGTDGYYHVDSEDGPILLADLMGYTRFSSDNTAYYMAGELLENGKITQEQYDSFIRYCSYASNSTIYGACPVTEELREMLVTLSKYFGVGDDKDWLRFCCYYDAYGTNGSQLEDPIKGLSTFSAYEVIESQLGDEDYPNKFVYNRVIMPRGLVAKFTPTVSGTYLITSYAPDPDNEGYGLETNAWVFTADDFITRNAWYTYENVDRSNTHDLNNCYMMLYLEAGKDYYIDIAFYDVYQTGTVNFRVECLGGEGTYRFSLASPGPFTALESVTGELTETIIRGISVELDENGFYREKRGDGRLGSLIYADFTQYTTIFTGNVIYYDGDDPKRIDMIEAGAFNFMYSEEDLYVLNYLNKVGGDVEKCKADLKEELGDAYNAKYTDYNPDGSPYTVTGFAVEEVLSGTYHGVGKDESDTMREYAKKIIKAGDTITTVNEDGTGTVTVVVEEGSPMIGCVAVDAELAAILQKLMDKYTFEGVENSWLKLCYYEQYFNAATPK